MNYFDFEQEKKSYTATFEEDQEFMVRKENAEHEEKIHELNQPINFGSTGPRAKHQCKHCKRDIYNPKHPTCPDCANEWR